MAKNEGRKSGGARKYGRNLVKCGAYKKENRQKKNKIRRYIKMLRQTKQLDLRKKILDIGLNSWELIGSKVKIR